MHARLGFAILLAIVLPLMPGLSTAQVPGILNYQGYVTSGGSPVNGSTVFRFALVDAAGTTTLWSNDGTSANGGEPTAGVALGVVNGLVSVLLGDAAIPNMTAIPVSVFAGSDVRLRVWFNDAMHGSQLLIPDRRVVATGYALHAATADALAPTASVPGSQVTGSISAATLPAIQITGTLATAQLADGAVTAAKMAGNGCANGQVLKRSAGVWTCASDDAGSGTVSSVATGAGLSGGPITATGTISVAPLGIATTHLADGAVTAAKMAVNGCANGQVLKLSAGVWTCAPDDAGSGTVSSVATGAGLSGGPITATGTISVAPLGIATTHLADGAVTAAKMATNGCGSGQMLKIAGGVWTCATDLSNSGTVTSVATGAGLSGGPITATGTISVAPLGIATTHLADGAVTVAKMATNGCGSGQVLKIAGGVWTCATDLSNSGTVTSVSTGTGLTGGPITGSGTISVAPSGISATQLATDAVTTTKILNLNVTSGKLADGAVTAAKLADGAVSSGKLAAGIAGGRPTQASRTLDPGTGQHSTILMGGDGLPFVAYYDQVNQRLKAQHCDDLDCTTSTTSIVDPGPGVGQEPSVTIGFGNNPVIAYYDATQGALKIAYCLDRACTTSSRQTVDTNNDTGRFPSIVSTSGVLPSGALLISYYDNTLKDLKLAVCLAANCNSPSIGTVVSAGDVGQWSAMTVLGNGDLAIAYYDATAHLLRLVMCSAFVSCTSGGPVIATIETLGADLVEGIAITTNHPGNAVISYARRVTAGTGSYKVAVCNSFSCTAPVITLLDNIGPTELPKRTSVTIPPDGLPVIALSPDHSGTACDSVGPASSSGSFVKCGSTDCSTLSYKGFGLLATANPAITTGSDGFPIASAWSCASTSAGTQLKLIHCGNASCHFGFRPR